MAYSPSQRRILRAKYGRKLPPPLPEPDGVWLTDPDERRTVFVPFDYLERIAHAVMDPRNAQAVEEDLGKMDWRKDPTYNLRRKR